MKIGMNLMLYSSSPKFSQMEPEIDKLKSFGYDAFELPIGELDSFEIDKFSKKALAMDMVVQCLDLFPVDEGDLIGKDPSKRRAAINRIKLGCHKTRDMGSKILSGPFFQGLGNSTTIGPTKEEWDWAVEGLQECAQEAKDCDIFLGAEPLNRFEMYIVNTIAEAYELISEVGYENMGILADTHHANIEELDVVKAYISHIDKIFNIHISENNRGIPGSGHGIPKDLFRALKENGYKGNLIIEAFNAEENQGLPLLRIWHPYAKTKDEVAIKGLKFIKDNLN